MSLDRHVKLFRNGRNQAVRIPREFELPGGGGARATVWLLSLPGPSRCLLSWRH